MTTSSTDTTQNRIDGEKRVARHLLDRLREEGFAVRIWGVESEGYETDFGAADDELLDAFSSLDTTRLDVFKGTEKVGWYLLVRGNSPKELIADFSEFEGAEEIYREVVSGEGK